MGYETDKPILKDIDLRIAMDDRIALLGANGNGKSTLIKLLSGNLEPFKGYVERDSKLKIGYFAQHQSDELDLNLTAYETLKEALPKMAEHNVRAMLGKFGFNKDKSDTKIRELSGGEKARLLFCIMSYDAPHIMLLDEPTNHLDIDARAALIQALNNYNGCIIIVSHDPHLVESVADRILLVKDGYVNNYEDDLETYRKLVIDQRRKEKSDAKKDRKNKKKDKKNKKNSNKGNNAQKLEKLVEKLSEDKKQSNRKWQAIKL